MTVNYKGMDKDFNYRLAEINFDDEKEQRLMNRIEQVMRIKGYEINQVADGYASCEVDSMDEYKDFVKEYKETKKQRKLLNFGRNLECKAVTAAIKSPLGCERPAEMPGLEQNKKKMEDKIMMTIKEAYDWMRKNTNLMQDTMMLDFECLEYCVKHGILKEIDKEHFEVA